MLTKGTVYHWTREGKHVIFMGYDESGLAMVSDGKTDYVCQEEQLEPIKKQVKMTAQEILDRDG